MLSRYYRYLFCLLLISSSFAGVYDTLEFDDARDVVKKKLHASKIVKAKATESIFGDVGLNGLFICKEKLAGTSYSLYFDWEDNKLSKVTLRSDNADENQYYADIQDAWNEALTLLNSVHGIAEKENTYPSQFKHREDGIVFSHLWHIDESTAVALGTGREKDRYYLAIQFLKPSSL